jgi:hypothetical protein
VAGADKRTVRVHTRRNGQPHTLDVSDEMNLRAIVEREMREVAPEGTVSSQELCVEVHSNDVPNLDLLDLPGACLHVCLTSLRCYMWRCSAPRVVLQQRPQLD